MSNLVPFHFQTPLVTGKTTILQKYYRLSNTLSPAMFGLWAVCAVGLYQIMPLSVWLISGISIPVTGLIGHIFLTRFLTQAERQNADCQQVRISPQGIAVDLENGEKSFSYENIQHIRVVYSGYERNLLHFRKQGENTANEISFKHRGQLIRIPFRLYSEQDMFALQDVLLFWREAGISFEEYNAINGIPIKSNLLELN